MKVAHGKYCGDFPKPKKPFVASPFFGKYSKTGIKDNKVDPGTYQKDPNGATDLETGQANGNGGTDLPDDQYQGDAQTNPATPSPDGAGTPPAAGTNGATGDGTTGAAPDPTTGTGGGTAPPP
jgi:penicillin-binding protein 1A